MVESKKTVVLEGSRGVAEAVRLCRPNVIAAYPITPQTHIVENLSQMVADGILKAENIRVESEHSAASAVLGASAAGARAYTATTSQGFLLMFEVLYNIAGLRLPIVLTAVNRGVSAPLTIHNDIQDSIAARDTGFIQLYAEDNQEALDMHIQAFKIAEDRRILLPVLIGMDGFILTHSFEPLSVPTQEEVDEFLPPYKPIFYLTPKAPLTMGTKTDPEFYTEARYMLHVAQQNALKVIPEVAREFKEKFGRFSGDLIDTFQTEDAEIIFVSMGSLVSNLRAIALKLRKEGKKVGVLKIRTFRPFPFKEILDALSGAKLVIVMEKDVSFGSAGVLAQEIRATFYGKTNVPRLSGFVVGLGGRDVTEETVLKGLKLAQESDHFCTFLDLNPDLLEEV
ncbi:MAG: pyruvate ferredoxin oxidoreductase [Caldiserica bacterium]|jgi:pyruvate ferredoxin oxidoreductase alpha subunit|nr:pyruvate ferredoxin oxidoreductase [Caldisericota bacterium]MDH7563074.1 transketolase C-terminal domain-containing protein [Caldisericota bacterium]